MTVVLEVAGELEVGTVDILRTWLSSIVDHGGADVAVDLAAVAYIDSTGINELFRARAHLESDGRRLAISAATPPIERLLQISGWRNP